MDAPAPAIPERHPGVLQDLRSLGHELGGLLHEQVGLAALETRQAGESLVSMITLGVIVAGLLLSAWLGLLAVAVLALIERGVMSASAALLLAVGANLLLALILYGAIRRHRPRLQFPATVRSLAPDPEQS